jgi:hypothetical protein
MFSHLELKHIVHPTSKRHHIKMDLKGLSSWASQTGEVKNKKALFALVLNPPMFPTFPHFESMEF